MARNQSSDRRPTKAERKEQARIEREEIQRRQAARSRNRILLIVVAVVLAAIVVGVVVWAGGGSGSPTPTSVAVTLPDPATLKGIMQTAPPWSPNTDQLGSRLAELHLPELSDAPGVSLHHHIGLYIFVDGQQVEIPAQIGLSQSDASPLHTHTATGLVHIESADLNFQPVLGQFMDVWGVYMTPTCLGDSCNDGDRQLRVYVNGQQYTGDPTLLPLTDQLVVVVTFGTADQVPDPLPNSVPTS